MDPPDLDPDFDAAWIAWTFLSHFRPNLGFGPSSIPLRDVLAYMDLRGVPEEARLELADQIRIIDGEFLSWRNQGRHHTNGSGNTWRKSTR